MTDTGMIRDYLHATEKPVKFFVGTEIEKTPAYGMKTLFVVGIQDASTIINLAEENECQHVYFGANHSFKFDITTKTYEATVNKKEIANKWFEMIKLVLDHGITVTLDFDISYAAIVSRENLSKYRNFIPVVSAKIPSAYNLGPNACLKIDDVGFNISNTGVWVHNLSSLLNSEKITTWSEYKQDKVIDHD